eukprot:5250479-Pyramimonas_sp.AAC.1
MAQKWPCRGRLSRCPARRVGQGPRRAAPGCVCAKEGGSDLHDSELARLKIGTATFHFLCRAIVLRRALGAPVPLENPQHVSRA